MKDYEFNDASNEALTTQKIYINIYIYKSEITFS